METQEIYRGRLIDHLHLVVSDLSRSRRFYEKAMSALGLAICGEGHDFFWIDELFVSSIDSPAAQGKATGRIHFAFQASSKEAVETFYKLGLAAGGTDNGAPGERPYHPGYFACFLLDPDGNNVEAVFHGPAKRSSDAIKITFDS